MERSRDDVVSGKVVAEELVLRQVKHAGDRPEVPHVRIVPWAGPPSGRISPARMGGCKVEVVDVFLLEVELGSNPLPGYVEHVAGIVHRHPYRGCYSQYQEKPGPPDGQVSQSLPS